jgi:hypothetical protein
MGRGSLFRVSCKGLSGPSVGAWAWMFAPRPFVASTGTTRKLEKTTTNKERVYDEN